MKKRKLMLSVLLSAAMTASCITPAFAGELSSGEENGLVSEEIMEIIPENIPGTEEPQTESAETEIPEVETPEVEIPEEEMPEAETPEVETPEVETPEQEVLPFEELGDGFQEGQAAESGTSVNAVSSAVHAKEMENIQIMYSHMRMRRQRIKEFLSVPLKLEKQREILIVSFTGI